MATKVALTQSQFTNHQTVYFQPQQIILSVTGQRESQTLPPRPHLFSLLLPLGILSAEKLALQLQHPSVVLCPCCDHTLLLPQESCLLQVITPWLIQSHGITLSKLGIFLLQLALIQEPRLTLYFRLAHYPRLTSSQQEPQLDTLRSLTLVLLLPPSRL